MNAIIRRCIKWLKLYSFMGICLFDEWGNLQLDEIYLWITRTWPNGSQRINQNEYILQMIIKDIKVDIVHDPLSFDEPREKYYFDEKKSVTIDSIRNIAAGKFTTLAERGTGENFKLYYF